MANQNFSQDTWQSGVAGAVSASSLIVSATSTDTPLTIVETVETSTAAVRGIIAGQYSDDASSSRFQLRKARGTRTAPTIVVTADGLASIMAEGYDGANYLQMGRILFSVEGTVAATRVPTNLGLYTATNAAPSVLTEALRINSSQVIIIGQNEASTTVAPIGNTIRAAVSGIQASSVAGALLTISGSDAVAGSTNAGSAAGGGLTLTSGSAARLTNGNSIGGAIAITAGNGIGTSAGGAITLTSGNASNTNASSGGLITIQSPNSSAGTASGSIITSGAISLLTGTGSSNSTNSATGGNSGAISLTAGAGGAVSSNGATTQLAGSAGLISIVGGAGGAATGGNAGGTNTGGVGSSVTITSGAGGNASGGSGTRNGGNSGSITIATGVAGTGASANGTAGDIIFNIAGTELLRINSAKITGLNLILTGTAPSAAASQVSYSGNVRTTIGANGGATGLTALPLGYVDINVAGTIAQIPYYNRGA